MRQIGDLHPGNILINISKDGSIKLGILDCGIIYKCHSKEEHEVKRYLMYFTKV